MQKKVIYIAYDGKEFEDCNKCTIYELETYLKKLEIDTKNYYCPPPDDSEAYECDNYNWYKIQNEDDKKIIEQCYNIKISEDNYCPSIICIGKEIGTGKVYCHYFDECFEYILNLIKLLGVEEEIKEQIMMM